MIAWRAVLLGTLGTVAFVAFDPHSRADVVALLPIFIGGAALANAPPTLVELLQRRDAAALFLGWCLSVVGTCVAFLQAFYIEQLRRAGSVEGAPQAMQETLEWAPLVVRLGAIFGAVLATLFLLAAVIRLGLVSQRARDGLVFFTFPSTWLLLLLYGLVDRVVPSPSTPDDAA